MTGDGTRLQSPTLQAALFYAQHLGWPVFPLAPGSKIPLKGSRGFKDASTNPQQIHASWEKCPEANVAVDCGGAGLVVIDLDLKAGTDGLEVWGDLKARLGFDDRTLTSRTPSGGRHLFFLCPTGVEIRNSTGKLGAGIDVRVRGGYAVLPPSSTGEGDYAWEEGAGPACPEPGRKDNRQPAPLPPVLLPLLSAPPLPTRISSLQDLTRLRASRRVAGASDTHARAYARAALQSELDKLSRAVRGTRNNRLNQAAYSLGQLVGSGELERGEVEARLTQGALAAGLEPGETRKTIRSGLEAGIAQPRQIPDRRHVPAYHGTPAGQIAVTVGQPGAAYHLTDLGNAERLVARHGQDLRYCHPIGQWLVWDGRRWHRDDTAEVVRRATETVCAIYGEARQIVDEDRRKAIAKWALRSEARPRIQAMIGLAQSRDGMPVRPDELDPDPWLLTVDNGTLDLKTGELLPHKRAHLITKVAPVVHDPEAEAPTWHAFLQRIMAGNGALIAFLQRAVGYALTGDTREQALFILHGSGANGKSTFLETLGDLLGDYAQKTPTETLLRKWSGRVPNDLARMQGARLVTAVEAEEGEWLAESLVKQLTGGDRITARFLHREWFEFLPQCKIFLATNHKPAVRGTDQAIWRRIHLVPFRVSIPQAEQDRALGQKLRTELPGILAWAVRGCLAWQDQGLGVPPEVRQATAGYRGEMDILAGFLEDCCVEKHTAQVKVKALYQAYVQWCQANGERATSKLAFGRRLRERGLEQRRGTGGTRYWQGLGLLSEPEQLDLMATPGERETSEL
jgi:P4 family phage/plasmid primase-like protien